jgi:hypothetical protein
MCKYIEQPIELTSLSTVFACKKPKKEEINEKESL